MAVAELRGLLVMSYDEYTSAKNGTTYHSVVLYDAASKDTVTMDLDAAPNGNAIAPGTPVVVSCVETYSRTVAHKDGRSFVGKSNMTRHKITSMRVDSDVAKKTQPAAA